MLRCKDDTVVSIKITYDKVVFFMLYDKSTIVKSEADLKINQMAMRIFYRHVELIEYKPIHLILKNFEVPDVSSLQVISVKEGEYNELSC